MCSHASRKSATDPSIFASEPSTLTDATPSAVVLPMETTVTPASVYAFLTASTFSGATSMTMESSSAKSAAIGSFVAPLGRVTSTPASGCGNAISRIAVTTPPSLTSWPAEMSRL